jgi:hypothetical protein
MQWMQGTHSHDRGIPYPKSHLLGLSTCVAPVMSRTSRFVSVQYAPSPSLSVAGNFRTGIVSVFFDVDPAVCKARVAARTDHPTIPHGTAPASVFSIAFYRGWLPSPQRAKRPGGWGMAW